MAKTVSVQNNQVISKNTVLNKTIEVATSTLMSRILGLVREVLMVRFLGAGIISDAFFTAFKLPNSLRKVFAEGALSAAFIPTFVSIMKKDSQEQVSRLMSLSFLIFQGFLIACCVFIFFNACLIISYIAPGWFIDGTALPQVNYAVTYLRILIAFIVFLSSSALLAGALQSVNHFFVPAFSPVLLNIAFIAGILVCMLFGLPVTVLCYFILSGGLIQFLMHVYMYIHLQFTFESIDRKTWHYFAQVLIKFMPCLFSMSIMEINLFVSTSLATYLPKGSISLIYYANRFMGIPLGVFAVAFSTILLPYFSKISVYAPKRLSYYLFEATKVVFWVTVPITILMCIVSEKLFLTLFLSSKFTIEHVHEASWILIAFLAGLFIFSLNKILLNIFYSMHDTLTPVIVSIAAALTNYGASMLLMPLYGAFGIACAFVIAGAMQTVLFLFLLVYRVSFTLFIKQFVAFVINVAKQMVVGIGFFVIIVYIVTIVIQMLLPEWYAHILLNKLPYWLWMGPLLGLLGWYFYKTRRYFNIQLHFLD